MQIRIPVILAFLLLAGEVSARLPFRAPSAIRRTARSTLVVQGKLARIEQKTIKVESRPGDWRQQEVQVGIVKIHKSFVGAKGLTHIRVALEKIPHEYMGYGNHHLKSGKEVLLYLIKSSEHNVYLVRQLTDVMITTDRNFKSDVKAIQKIAPLVNDPMKYLKDKDPVIRLQTAILRLWRLRRILYLRSKEKPIPPEESKLILKALAEVSWNRLPKDFLIFPNEAFDSLYLTEKDGFVRPKDYRKLESAAKKWLNANMDKYVIKQRFPKSRTER